MAAALAYWTTRAVAEPLRTQIAEEAAAVQHDWWCESIAFFRWDAGEGDREDDPSAGPQLAGATKLFVLSVDPDDDTFMAARDARYIVELLARWSARHGLAWCVSIEDRRLGRVEGGRADAALVAALDDLAGGPPDEARAQTLLAAHPDR